MFFKKESPKKIDQTPQKQRGTNIVPKVSHRQSWIETMMYLQQTVGNLEVQKLIDSGVLQRKLKISQPGDKYEQEADRITEQVLREPALSAHKNTEQGNNVPHKDHAKGLGIIPPIQTKAVQSYQPSTITSRIFTNTNLTQGSGQPLPTATRQFFESRFSTDLRKVKIHANRNSENLSDEIGARAFTFGNHIYFNRGEYNPGDISGQRLLAHEVAHVVQNYHSYQQVISRSVKEKTFWFQEDEFTEERRSNKGVVFDPVPYQRKDPESGLYFTFIFAGMYYDFELKSKRERWRLAKERITDAIDSVVNNLLKEPEIPAVDITAPSERELNKKIREEMKRQRNLKREMKKDQARLMEAIFNKPLYIFIATNLTVQEKTGKSPAFPQTSRIYIDINDIGNEAKLQAAIRVPLNVLSEIQSGIKFDDKDKKLEDLDFRSWTSEEIEQLILHEAIHALLINRNASSKQVWEDIGSKICEGDSVAKKKCDEVIQLYLLWQEELFVYNCVDKIYPNEENVEEYRNAIKEIEDLFHRKSIGLLTKKIPMEVHQKAANKNVKFEIFYNYPSKIKASDIEEWQPPKNKTSQR